MRRAAASPSCAVTSRRPVGVPAAAARPRHEPTPSPRRPPLPEGHPQRPPRRADEPRRAARPAGAAHRPHRPGADPRPAHRAEHPRRRRPRLPARRGGPAGHRDRPGLRRNHWVYLYYSPPLDTPGRRPVDARRSTRATRPTSGTAGRLRAASRACCGCPASSSRQRRSTSAPSRRSSTSPVDRGICCHVGGQIDFDGEGNLYLSTGDDTNPFVSDGYAPIDERPGRNPAFDAQRSAGNTNDLRGKLLRIRVKAGRRLHHPARQPVPPGHAARPGPRSTRWACATRSGSRSTGQTGVVYLADYSPDARAPNPDARAGRARPVDADPTSRATTAGRTA